MAKTFTVAVRDGKSTLWASQDIEVGWVAARGLAGRISEVRKDEAVAEAVAAGLPYDVIEHDGQLAGGARIAGTVVLVDRF